MRAVPGKLGNRSSDKVAERLYAVCSPGLEPIIRQELRLTFGRLQSARAGSISSSQTPAPDWASALATQPSTDTPDSYPVTGNGEAGGGVEFSGDLEVIYRTNLHLRTASRVLVRFAEFHAAAFSELRRKANILAWERYLVPGQPLNIRVTCHKSRLYHSAAVAREIAAAIGDRLGKQPVLLKFEAESNSQLIIARLVNDECSLSIDSSGALLHRRGYRLETAKAPLRETLAAAMLLASGWDLSSPLLDPFCGSGTIPIEAALLAGNIPPGANRRFAFMNWPGFDPGMWQTLLTESQQNPPECLPKISASDRDAGAIQISQANARRAGVAEYIDFSHRAISAIEPVGKGWVVTNPPYGLRVSSSHDLRNLYAQFGNVLRANCPGWQVAVLCSDLSLLHSSGLKLDTSLSWVNGGIQVRLACGSVPG